MQRKLRAQQAEGEAANLCQCHLDSSLQGRTWQKAGLGYRCDSRGRCNSRRRSHLSPEEKLMTRGMLFSLARVTPPRLGGRRVNI